MDQTQTLTPDDDIEVSDPEIVETRDERPRPRKRGTSTRPRPKKPTTRQIAEKAEMIAAAEDATRDVLADLLHAPSPGIADLTTAIMDPGRNRLEVAIADLRVIQGSDLPEATVHLIGMDRESLSSLCRLVELFSAQDLPSRIPAKPHDAALALVRPVRGADVDSESLDRVLELLAR